MDPPNMAVGCECRYNELDIQTNKFETKLFIGSCLATKVFIGNVLAMGRRWVIIG